MKSQEKLIYFGLLDLYIVAAVLVGGLTGVVAFLALVAIGALIIKATS